MVQEGNRNRHFTKYMVISENATDQTFGDAAKGAEVDIYSTECLHCNRGEVSITQNCNPQPR